MRDQLAIQQKLDETYREIQLRHPAYSMRSFARRLGISSSALSEILNGRRRISSKMAERILEKISLSPAEKRAILKLFSEKERQSGMGEKLQLTIDQFRLIADWYHYGILSLILTEDFRYDCKWIARRLNITATQTKSALERLLRMGLVVESEIRGVKTLKRTFKKITSSDNVLNTSLQKMHLQELDLAKNSLLFDEVHQRSFTSMTMAIDPSRLPEAHQMIRRFHQRLSTLLEKGPPREVYKLSVHLYPVTDVTESIN